MRTLLRQGYEGHGIGEMRKFQITVYIPEIIYRAGVWILLICRRFRFGYSFRKIPLTHGKFAIVDEIDYDELNQFKWCAVKYGRTFYARRCGRVKNTNGKQFSTKMHRQIMKLPPDLCVDHINHNGLDNRRANLRAASQAQNNVNRRKQTGTYSSKYKGVIFSKRDRKWQAYIMQKGKHYFLGSFEDEEAAARAYDQKAKELFGQYACLNFPSNSPT